MAPLERIRRFSGAVEEGEEQNKDNRQKLGQTSHGRLLLLLLLPFLLLSLTLAGAKHPSMRPKASGVEATARSEATTEKHVEDLIGVKVSARGKTTTAAPAVPGCLPSCHCPVLMPIPIVCSAFISVTEAGERLGDSLEGLVTPASPVLVGVQFQRELAIGFLYVIVIRVLLDAQDAVVVLRSPNLSHQITLLLGYILWLCRLSCGWRRSRGCCWLASTHSGRGRPRL
mmetsp:Transcript_26074/g.46361  ORF Transcript_26074/g.46361 Transcript_26074/m.46361 type:complete len:228 (-) Transcript_26074:76-759(-)